MKQPVSRTAEGIKLHEAGDFEGMRRAGALAARTLDMIAPHVRHGVSTNALDRLCCAFIRHHGAEPAPLGYRGYPKSICTSINHVVCHGIPGERRLRRGDILNIDVAVQYDGWFGDSSRMYAVAPLSRKARRVIDVAHEALMRGIAAVRPGARFSAIGAAIQAYVEGTGCSVVREFCGHGLGRTFHDSPHVLHYRQEEEGAEVRPGMFFTIEPMINLGKPDTRTLPDGWTAVARDRSLSAQFEHSLGVSDGGVEIFTLSPKGLFHPFGTPSGAA